MEHAYISASINADYLTEPVRYVSGRDVVLEKLGISVDYWTSTGNAMALSELNLKYFAPLRVRTYLPILSAVNACIAQKYNPTCNENLAQVIFIYYLFIRRSSSERRQVRREGEACPNQRRADDCGAHDRGPAGS